LRRPVLAKERGQSGQLSRDDQNWNWNGTKKKKMRIRGNPLRDRNGSVKSLENRELVDVKKPREAGDPQGKQNQCAEELQYEG